MKALPVFALAVLASALGVAACGKKPEPTPSAGLASCESVLGQKVCRCAFEAMETKHYQAFAAWAAKQKAVRDPLAVWDDPGLKGSLLASVESPAEGERVEKELGYLKRTCGPPISEHA